MSQTPKKGKGLFLAVVIILVAVLGVEAYLLLRPAPQIAPPDAAKKAIASGPQEITTFGTPSAPVKIDFYAPLVLEWHQKTVGLLREYDKKHPGKIYVTLMPMGIASCDTKMQDLGYRCATILVNDKNEFKLPGSREVTLSQRPNETSSFYNSEDVITVINQTLAGR